MPELVEDNDTAVMDAIDPQAAEAPARPSNPELQDDGKSTTMMEAVDLAALGLDASISARMSAEMPAVEVDDDDDPGTTSPGIGGDKKPGGNKKKRKKR